MRPLNAAWRATCRARKSAGTSAHPIGTSPTASATSACIYVGQELSQDRTLLKEGARSQNDCSTCSKASAIKCWSRSVHGCSATISSQPAVFAANKPINSSPTRRE